jgi:hypothetical protein
MAELVIAGLDPSTFNCGIAVVIDGRPKFIDTFIASSRIPEYRMLSLCGKISELLKKFRPHFVFMEGIFLGFRQQNPKTLIRLGQLQGMIQKTCYDVVGYFPAIVTVASWKTRWRLKRKYGGSPIQACQSMGFKVKDEHSASALLIALYGYEEMKDKFRDEPRRPEP